MESEYGMDYVERTIANFTDNLAEEIAGDLTNKEGNTIIRTYALDKNTGFVIQLDYNHKHSMEIMISNSGSKKKGELTIDRFFGIKPINSTGKRSSSPDELRCAAQIYDEMTNFLNNKFGNPITNSGSAIYTTKLEELVKI